MLNGLPQVKSLGTAEFWQQMAEISYFLGKKKSNFLDSLFNDYFEYGIEFLTKKFKISKR